MNGLAKRLISTQSEKANMFHPMFKDHKDWTTFMKLKHLEM